MLKRKLKQIIKDFYETTLYALQYKPTDQSKDLLRRILALSLAANGESDSLDECWEAVASTENILTASDAALLDSSSEDVSGVNAIAYEIKVQMLIDAKIERSVSFDYDLFLLQIEKSAARGHKFACKLLACLKWIGFGDDANKETAVEIWKALATDGDAPALNMLIYALGELGKADEANVWEQVRDVTEKAKESFTPIAKKTEGVSDEAFEKAAVILFLLARPKKEEAPFMNRTLIHYLIHSTDSLDTKLKAVTLEEDIYLRMYMEDRFKNRKYGF